MDYYCLLLITQSTDVLGGAHAGKYVACLNEHALLYQRLKVVGMRAPRAIYA